VSADEPKVLWVGVKSCRDLFFLNYF